MSIDNRNDANQAMGKLPRQDTGSTQVQITPTISSDIAEPKLDSTTQSSVDTASAEAGVASTSHKYTTEYDDNLGATHSYTDISPSDCDRANSISQSCTHEKKVRAKKRTMQENTTLYNAIKKSLHEGHPPEAIAIMCKVQLATVQKAIVNLLSIGELPSCAPKYTVLGGGKYIKDIISLSITKADYVSITPTGDGDSVIIKPFNIMEN